MEKPKKPIYPNHSDKIKYPQPKTKEGRNYLGQPIYLPNADWIRDVRQYEKAVKQYEIDLELYEQNKLIRLVKNASEKLILKKYRIIPIDRIDKTKVVKNNVIFKLKD